MSDGFCKLLKLTLLLHAMLVFAWGQAYAATAVIKPSVTTVVSGSDIVVRLDGSGSVTTPATELLEYRWRFLGTSMDVTAHPLYFEIESKESLGGAPVGKVPVLSFAASASLVIDWGDSTFSFKVPATGITESIVLYVGLEVYDAATGITSTMAVQNINILPANFLETDPSKLSFTDINSRTIRVMERDPVILNALSLISLLGIPTDGLTDFRWEYIKTINFDGKEGQTLNLLSSESITGGVNGSAAQLSPGSMTEFGDQYLSFTAPTLSPNEGMVLIFGLTARNGINYSLTKQLISIVVQSQISTTYGNLPTNTATPIPNTPVSTPTTGTYTVTAGQGITLDGSGARDSKGTNLLSYQWQYVAAVNVDSSSDNTVMVSSSEISLSGKNITKMGPSNTPLKAVVSPPPFETITEWGDQYISFYAPTLLQSNKSLIMVFGLSVKDAYGQVSTQAPVIVNVISSTTDSAIKTPIAAIDVINGKTTFNPWDTINLDGSRSSAPAGVAPGTETLKYSWSVSPTDLFALSNATDPKPTVFVPPLATGTTLTVYLTVIDSIGTPSMTVMKQLIVNPSSTPLSGNCLGGGYQYVIPLMDAAKSPLAIKISGGSLLNVNVYHQSQTNVSNIKTALSTQGKPDSLPYGLLDFEIKMGQAQNMALVDLCFSSAVSAGSTWWKYFNGQWIDMPGYDNGRYFKFNPTRTGATLILIDGGFGDSNSSTPGIIKDPGGLGPSPTSPPSPSPSPPATAAATATAAAATAAATALPPPGPNDGSSGDTKVGCTMNPNARFDPTFALMLAFSLIHLSRRRNRA
ncbi:MAG: hypothetical protein HW380_627 [Magnetococcales bacterium]|nr:hypothetical protein [Magnetococcales bacterium]